jgi:hypothetical protein
VVISHPPCSPDFAPADVFLLSKLKRPSKGKKIFQVVEHVKKNVTAKLKAGPMDLCYNCFVQLLEKLFDSEGLLLSKKNRQTFFIFNVSLFLWHECRNFV